MLPYQHTGLLLEEFAVKWWDPFGDARVPPPNRSHSWLLTNFSTKCKNTSTKLCQSVSGCLSETWSFCQPYLQGEFHLYGAVTIQFQLILVSVLKWNSGAVYSNWTGYFELLLTVLHVELLFTSINNNEFYVLKSQRLFLFYFLGDFPIFFPVYFPVLLYHSFRHILK